ncbi:MAG: lipoate--protein ligase family protein [Firmicutes bacterium]|nr:lipoate--protein ligase family protein [Bacillota bacterium]
MTDWRLIISPAADGAWNMAVDEAVLEAVSSGSAPPTLRFFTWDPACLSLGYNQKAAESCDMGYLKARGFTMVRRRTGGRAVLHEDELTYSISADSSLFGGGSVLDVYMMISGALSDGLRAFGVAADLVPAYSDKGKEKSAACFDVPSSFEVAWKGRKIVGSAQFRSGRFFLQHGSILMSADVDALVKACALPEGMKARLEGGIATVGEALGRKVGRYELVPSIAGEFRKLVGSNLIESGLTSAEKARARELLGKYGDDSWNLLK